MGICSVLNVISDNELPAIFHSRQLNGAEKRYSITELESLAIVDFSHTPQEWEYVQY